jgi:hypothetical protein
MLQKEALPGLKQLFFSFLFVFFTHLYLRHILI